MPPAPRPETDRDPAREMLRRIQFWFEVVMLVLGLLLTAVFATRLATGSGSSSLRQVVTYAFISVLFAVFVIRHRRER